jgi:hypothetical protein
MHALETGELLASERPTIPVPAPLESEIRLRVARVPRAAMTVEVVMCDLTRDRRSESYIPEDERGRPQNERPPSTSIVLALK